MYDIILLYESSFCQYVCVQPVCICIATLRRAWHVHDVILHICLDLQFLHICISILMLFCTFVSIYNCYIHVSAFCMYVWCIEYAPYTPDEKSVTYMMFILHICLDLQLLHTCISILHVCMMHFINGCNKRTLHIRLDLRLYMYFYVSFIQYHSFVCMCNCLDKWLQQVYMPNNPGHAH